MVLGTEEGGDGVVVRREKPKASSGVFQDVLNGFFANMGVDSPNLAALLRAASVVVHSPVPAQRKKADGSVGFSVAEQADKTMSKLESENPNLKKSHQEDADLRSTRVETLARIYSAYSDKMSEISTLFRQSEADPEPARLSALFAGLPNKGDAASAGQGAEEVAPLIFGKQS